IVTDFLNPESVLLVSIGDKVFEEHFTCNLHFSWPQVSCVSTQCPPRGSRVIFASYKDCHGQASSSISLGSIISVACDPDGLQIQKFALRFASSCDAETFIGALKDSLKDAMEMGVTRSDSGSELSSQSEFVPSDRLQFRPEELSFVDPVATYSPQMRSILNYNSNENRCCQESLVGQGQNFERVSQVDLPPSFTALLTNCSTEVEQEKVMAPDELDLESLVMRYASESSFLDMLDKIDEVITEMGGDLAL
ncbi:hypothetical protein IFM89_025461, partial [Coptis chinensis]